MLGLNFALGECKNVWQWLEKERPSEEGELQGRLQAEALRLDFTITYFQLNGFLIDNFHDSEYFARMSYLETINECKPAALMVSNLTDLGSKLKSLDLIR